MPPISTAMASARRRLRSVIATRAPRAASIRQQAAPMLLAPPVTAATLLAKRPSLVPFLPASTLDQVISSWMPSRRTTAAHFVISLRMKAANSSGVP